MLLAMGKRAQLALTVLAIAILAGTALVIVHYSEPTYRGHSLSYWLQQYNEAQTIRKFELADDAIRAIGTNGLPRVVSDLGRRGSVTERLLSTLCFRHPWIKLPIYGEDHYSGPALMALKALGAQAKPILPQLASLLGSNTTMDRAAQAFLMVGPASIPTLETACQNTNVAIRVQAAALIAVIKSHDLTWGYGYHKSPVNGRPVLFVGWAFFEARAQKSIDQLAEGLRSPDPAIRLANQDALRSIGGAASYGFPCFILRHLAAAKEDVAAAREALRRAGSEPAARSDLK